MNKFAAHKSVLFFILTWVFIAALFADSANLDDLLPGSIVMHDDEDAVSPASAELLCINASSLAIVPLSFAHKPSRATPDPIPVRFIVDQDSPSLPAVYPVDTSCSAPITADPAVVVDHQIPLRGSLYLRYCTLLI